MTSTIIPSQRQEVKRVTSLIHQALRRTERVLRERPEYTVRGACALAVQRLGASDIIDHVYLAVAYIENGGCDDSI